MSVNYIRIIQIVTNIIQLINVFSCCCLYYVFEISLILRINLVLPVVSLDLLLLLPKQKSKMKSKIQIDKK